MSGSPLTLLDQDTAEAAARAASVPAPLADLNVFHLLLRRPRLAKAVSDLLLSLLYGADLDDRLRELIIMRVAWATGSEYEWSQHWRIATRLGVEAEELVRVRDGSGSGFEPKSAAVLTLADEVSSGGEAGSTTTAELCRLLGEDAALEAVATASAWTMLSSILRSFAVPLEEGMQPWPPDGNGPRP